MGTNYTISVEGEYKDSCPLNGEFYELEQLQEIVGGLIDIITLGDGMIMVINDEGKYLCEPNLDATILARLTRSIFPNDYIAGNVLVCKSELVP